MFDIFKNLEERRRKKKLGEKYTSTITDRKFATKSFIELNPKIDLESIYFIYSLGIFKRSNFWIFVIEKCLKARLFNFMNSLVADVSKGEDEMGYVPLGDYVEVFIWRTKKNEYYAQLIGGTFYLPFHLPKENSLSFIVSTIKIGAFNPKLIVKRKLVYPI